MSRRIDFRPAFVMFLVVLAIKLAFAGTIHLKLMDVIDILIQM